MWYSWAMSVYLNVQKIIHLLFFLNDELQFWWKLNEELENDTILSHIFLNFKAIFVRQVTNLFSVSLQWKYLTHILWTHKPEKQNSVYKFSMLYLSASK